MQNPHSTRLDENQFFTEHKFITSLEALSGALSLAAKKFNDEFSLSCIFHFIHVGGKSEKETFHSDESTRRKKRESWKQFCIKF